LVEPESFKIDPIKNGCLSAHQVIRSAPNIIMLRRTQTRRLSYFLATRWAEAREAYALADRAGFHPQMEHQINAGDFAMGKINH